MYSTHSVALAGSGFRGRPVGHDGNRAVGRACDVAGRLTSMAAHEVHPGLFLQPAGHPLRWRLLTELARSDRVASELTGLLAVLTDCPATS